MKRNAILLLTLACPVIVIVLLRQRGHGTEHGRTAQNELASQAPLQSAQQPIDQQQGQSERVNETPAAVPSPGPVEPSPAASEVDASVESMLPHPPTPARRLWKFKNTLKSYRGDNAKVMDAHFVLTTSIVEILNSQGMAIVGDDQPDV